MPCVTATVSARVEVSNDEAAYRSSGRSFRYPLRMIEGRQGSLELSETPGRGREAFVRVQGAESLLLPNRWDIAKIRVPCFGVLIIRILLFRVPYWGPLFSEPPQMERMRADGVLPERKVQWLIVRLISTRLQDCRSGHAPHKY